MKSISNGDFGGRTVGGLRVPSASVRCANFSRRRFLAAATAAIGAPAIMAVGRANETTARSGLIDCQSHLFCPQLVELMETRTSDPVVFVKDGVRTVKMGDWLRKIPPHYMDVDVKLAAMDAAGVERTALSINDPGPEWFGTEGLAVARMANDFVAGIVARHPQRFFGLCVLPLQDMRRCAD